MRDGGKLSCGIAWMIAAQLLFAASWAAIKLIGTRVPVMEIVFFRGLISFLLLLGLTILRKKSLRGSNHSALFVRSVFGFAAMALAFYSMTRMQIGNASTLFNTLPIFVALLAPVFLSETFLRSKFFLVMTGFVGIGLMLRPTSEIIETVSLSALTAGLFGALAMLAVRKMATSDSSYVITLYFTGFTAICSAPFALDGFVVPLAREWILIGFIGVSLTLAQLFMTHAYKLGHASTIAPFSYASVIGAYALGIILFDEIPDAWSIIGAAIVIGSGTGIMLTAPTSRGREEIRSAKVT